jgi:NADH dehydrogenase [ubiquinone] 1 alpha subcomplex assembly factor 7
LYLENMDEPSPATILKQRLASQGPISVADYMAWCLTGHDDAYYRKGNPLGASGDFITAPEISQLFGEMLGMWAMAVWAEMGAPKPFALVELGPGRGTLMQDLLRIGAAMPGFREAARVHLVEASATLREMQREMLAGLCVPTWHDTVATLPAGPMIVIANEFVDALPVEQYAFLQGEWRLRMIGMGRGGAPAFVAGPPAVPPATLLPNEPSTAGAILEHHPAIAPLVAEFGRRARQVAAPLVMVVIDYGYAERGYGDTFQAMRNHTYVDPLAAPGEADLTAHVNFAALRHAAESAGLAAWGPMTQGAFLRQLGLEFRLQQLLNTAREDQRAALISGAERLIDAAHMGDLFKVLVVTSRDLPAPPPFGT